MHAYPEVPTWYLGRLQWQTVQIEQRSCATATLRQMAAARRLRLHTLGPRCGGNGSAASQPRALLPRPSRPSARRLAQHRPHASAQAIARARAVALDGASAGCQLPSHALHMAHEACAIAGGMHRHHRAAAADSLGRLEACASVSWKVPKESTRRPLEAAPLLAEVGELAADTSLTMSPSSKAIDSTNISSLAVTCDRRARERQHCQQNEKAIECAGWQSARRGTRLIHQVAHRFQH